MTSTTLLEVLKPTENETVGQSLSSKMQKALNENDLEALLTFKWMQAVASQYGLE